MKMADRCVLSLLMLCLTVICHTGEAVENANSANIRKCFLHFICISVVKHYKHHILGTIIVLLLKLNKR